MGHVAVRFIVDLTSEYGEPHLDILMPALPPVGANLIFDAHSADVPNSAAVTDLWWDEHCPDYWSVYVELKFRGAETDASITTKLLAAGWSCNADAKFEPLTL